MGAAAGARRRCRSAFVVSFAARKLTRARWRSSGLAPQGEEDDAGLVQLLAQDDGRDDDGGPRSVDDAERKGDARGGRDERADAADEPVAAALVAGVAKGAVDVTDGPPGEHGGQYEKTLGDQRAHQEGPRAALVRVRSLGTVQELTRNSIPDRPANSCKVWGS